MQSSFMESNWASDHLQVIRTLMERSALYRRALAPIMLLNGILGIFAATVGLLVPIVSPRGFISYWMLVGLAALVASFLMTRRQALRDVEPFWSPPTRRVGQAILPALSFGLLSAVALLLCPEPSLELSLQWMPVLWVALYGCGLHAAGFFMHRGVKFFGWAFVLGAGILAITGLPRAVADAPAFGHGAMGLFFGLAHLAYGLYLYFTEPRRTSA
jgi:hypothetical protein